MEREEFIELLDNFCGEFYDEDSCKYYGDNYSGRGMFGCKCPALSVNCNLMEVIIRLCDYIRDTCEDDVCSAEEVLGTVCTDQLGLGTVMYFPNYSER